MHSPGSGPFPALPGTTPKPQALFLDRWGTLLDPPDRGYAEKPSEVRFYDGVLDALFRAGQAGWRVYLIGNEDAVAHGSLPHDDWQEVQARILAELEGAGVPLVRDYACLDHPEGVGKHRGESVYMLPNTGAFYHACHVDGIELAKSWVIGDSTLELVAGWRSGCRLASVETGLALSDQTFHVDPEFTGGTLREVVAALLATEDVYLRRA